MLLWGTNCSYGHQVGCPACFTGMSCVSWILQVPQQAVNQQGVLPQQGLPQQQQQHTPASAYQHQLQQAQGAMQLGMPLQAGVQQHLNGEGVPRRLCGMCLMLSVQRSPFPERSSPGSCDVL